MLVLNAMAVMVVAVFEALIEPVVVVIAVSNVVAVMRVAISKAAASQDAVNRYTATDSSEKNFGLESMIFKVQIEMKKCWNGSY